MKVVGYVSVFIAGLVSCYLLFSLGVVDRVDGIPGTLEEPALSIPTYLSFVSVMMTAVTVVLAAVAIGIGIVAAYTFQKIESKALKKVDSAVGKALSDDVIKARIDEVAFGRKQTHTLDELEEGFDPTDTGER